VRLADSLHCSRTAFAVLQIIVMITLIIHYKHVISSRIQFNVCYCMFLAVYSFVCWFRVSDCHQYYLCTNEQMQSVFAICDSCFVVRKIKNYRRALIAKEAIGFSMSSVGLCYIAIVCHLFDIVQIICTVVQ